MFPSIEIMQKLYLVLEAAGPRARAYNRQYVDSYHKDLRLVWISVCGAIFLLHLRGTSAVSGVQVFKLITLDKIYVPVPYDVEAELLIGDGRGTEKHGRKQTNMHQQAGRQAEWCIAALESS
jgi:hypothetical protein